MNDGGGHMEKGLAAGQYKPLRQDQLGRIHETALKILEEIGITVDLPEARDIFAKGGARVDTDTGRVIIPAKMVERRLMDAPQKIVLCGKNPEQDLVLEDSRTYMGTGGAALRVIDPETGEVRPGTLADIANLARLVERLENVHFFIRPCLAQEIPKEKLGVHEFYAAIANTTKHVMGAGYTPQGVMDIIDMAALIAGGKETLLQRPFISFTAGWMRSPLTFDPRTTEVLITIIRQGLPVALASTPMAGSTAPITMAGTLTQLHAEELSGIVFAQMVSPGAPVLYGGVPGMADMHDLSFKAGGVEFGLMNAAISQLANYIGIPNYCSAGITEAKIPSLQAIYEKTFSICQCALAGSNYVHHAAGVLESILTVDYGQFVIDNEIIGMAMKMIKGIQVNEEALAFEEIKKTGPGGNFLSSRHTRNHMRSEFLEPMLTPRSDRTSPEQVQDQQHLDILVRARKRARDVICSGPAESIPEEIDARIRKHFGLQDVKLSAV